MSIKEKRSKQRIDLKENLKFGVNKLEYDGVSQNLSPNGMSILSDKALPMNSDIKIQFNGSLGDISIDGKVIWVSSPPGVKSIMGIRFTRSNDKLTSIYNSRSRYKI